MSEKVNITCIKCQSTWERHLHELENNQVIYRGETEQPQSEVVEYRAVCPVCGTYNIIIVQEE